MDFFGYKYFNGVTEATFDSNLFSSIYEFADPHDESEKDLEDFWQSELETMAFFLMFFLFLSGIFILFFIFLKFFFILFFS